MNKQTHILTQISDYLDGLLVQIERDHVEAHLVKCEACQQAMDNLRQVKRKLREMPAVELPPDAKVRLYDTLNQNLSQEGKGQMLIPSELLAKVKAKSQTAVSEKIDKVMDTPVLHAGKKAKRGVDAAKTAVKKGLQAIKITPEP